MNIFSEIFEYILHRSSKLAYLDFKTRLTNYDQQRNEKLRNNITKYKKKGDDIICICMYSLWTCIPGFWFSSFIGFGLILLTILSTEGAININSLNNRNTFMTESKPALNMQILFAAIAISIVFGINFQFMFSFLLVWELIKINSK